MVLSAVGREEGNGDRAVCWGWDQLPSAGPGLAVVLSLVP